MDWFQIFGRYGRPTMPEKGRDHRYQAGAEERRQEQQTLHLKAHSLLFDVGSEGTRSLRTEAHQSDARQPIISNMGYLATRRIEKLRSKQKGYMYMEISDNQKRDKECSENRASKRTLKQPGCTNDTVELNVMGTSLTWQIEQPDLKKGKYQYQTYKTEENQNDFNLVSFEIFEYPWIVWDFPFPFSPNHNPSQTLNAYFQYDHGSEGIGINQIHDSKSSSIEKFNAMGLKKIGTAQDIELYKEESRRDETHHLCIQISLNHFIKLPLSLKPSPKMSRMPGRLPAKKNTKTVLEPIDIPDFDNSEMLESFNLTLAGRVINMDSQANRVNAIVKFLPETWSMSGRVTGEAVGRGKFLFHFATEADLKFVLEDRPYCFDQWMLPLERWEQSLKEDFPSTMVFWVRVTGIPIHLIQEVVLKKIGNEIGKYHKSDVSKARVRISVECDAPLQYERKLCFALGDEIKIELEYERLQKSCFICYRFNHDSKRCPKLGVGVRVSIRVWIVTIRLSVFMDYDFTIHSVIF